jgi:hypothetical protein
MRQQTDVKRYVFEESVLPTKPDVVVVVGGDQGPEPRLRLHCSH